MRNNFKTTITLRRIDICDLLIACLAAKRSASDEGKKWEKLHDLLYTQLEELDAQIDEIIDFHSA